MHKIYINYVKNSEINTKENGIEDFKGGEKFVKENLDETGNFRIWKPTSTT